jgi:mono/diheme cytochrome c family protein
MNLYQPGLLKRPVLLQALLLALSFSLSLSVFADIHAGGDKAKGEQLFKANCASCHRPNGDVLAAPGLAGVKDRWKGKDELLTLWIQNPPAAIATGDAYVKSLMEKYQGNFGIMQAQAVSADDIKHILTYVAEYKDPVAVEETGGTDNWYVWDENEGKLESNPFIWFLILGILFLVIALSASGVRRALQSAVLESQGKEGLPHLSYWARFKVWAWENKVFVSLIGLFVTGYLVVVAYSAGMGVGVYEGYQPNQPIKFSHKLHAGKNKIDCQYCHSSASKSKHAGIPSVNVCMNCHKGIKQGHNDEFTAEIQKIYDAIGFDPATSSYIENYEQKPIEWVKVHNLPDHVYFNHAQHVAVGGLQCQNCHGPVETYTTGKIAPVSDLAKVDLPGIIQLEKPTLTMGWCIECHNKAEVQMAGNGYYDEIMRRLEETERGNEELRHYHEDDKITVKELGGWECAKCHY